MESIASYFYSTEVSLYPVALSGSSRLTKQQR
jgi:hypothetical protein